MNNRNVLYLSYDGMTDPLGQAQVIPYLKGLSQKGYHIQIVSFEKKNRLLQYRSEIEVVLAQSGITWHPLLYTSTPPVLSTLYDIYRLLRIVKQLVKNNSIALIHCRSYITSLVGMSVKSKLGVPFIFDMRGFWADERIDGRIWNTKIPLYKSIYTYFKNKEKQFLKEAAAVISLTQNAAREINSWSGFETLKITVIPCCADLDLFSLNRTEQNNRLQELRNSVDIRNDQFVVSYLGSIGTWYMLNEMLDFFAILLHHKPNSIFLFITPDEADKIYNAAQVKGIEKEFVRVKSAQRNEVPFWAALSNISLFFILPSYSKKASSPTKMGELMAGGIPLIVNSGVGDVAEILNDGANGIVLDSFDREALENACSQIDTLLISDPQNSVRCAQKYYALDKGIEAYEAVYKSLIG
jgi:glycosyltransferase involved in cell wall biosynthesis